MKEINKEIGYIFFYLFDDLKHSTSLLIFHKNTFNVNFFKNLNRNI